MAAQHSPFKLAAPLLLQLDPFPALPQVNSKAATYWAAPNQFADRSPEERAGYLGATLMPVPTPEAEGTELIERRRRLQRSLLEVPTVVDWTAEGKVTPVGNQAGVSRQGQGMLVLSSTAALPHLWVGFPAIAFEG